MAKNIEIKHHELRNILASYKPERVILVRGKTSYEKCGARKLLTPQLGEFKVVEISEFDQNPKLEDLDKNINKIGNAERDFYLAVGGGSVMDMAKMLNIMSHQDIVNTRDLLTGEMSVTKPGAPMVCIPTTFGTGSESTHFAVGYIGEKKYSFANRYTLPDYYLLDVNLARSGSQYLKASVGLDALCQAIESYWANGSTEESRTYSKSAIKKILPNLVAATINNDENALKQMGMGSNLSGRAINIAKTTAPHALSYAITSMFNIPHGHAVALTLPYFFELNWKNSTDEALKSRQRELFKLMRVEDAANAKVMLLGLMEKLNIKTKLSDFGTVNDSDLETIAKSVNLQRLANHPLKLSAEDLLGILKNLI